jgi:hypothetical protein
MTSIVLGHPYVGSLYAYISDQLGGDMSHTSAVHHHPYYRTLYGRNYKSYMEISLNFLLLFDDVWIVPADNHWPKSSVETTYGDLVPELGVHRDWKAFHGLPNEERDNLIDQFLADEILKALLTDHFHVPPAAQRLIVSEALHDAGLSAIKRIPLLCSPGRRLIINRLVALEQASLHPHFAHGESIEFIESFRAVRGLALMPKSLDDLMNAKPDASVRRYGSRFLELALAEQNPSTRRVAELIRDAIETERLAKLFAGALEWAATFFHLVVHLPQVAIPVAIAEKGAHSLLDRLASSSQWYEFSGAIDRAIDRAALLKRCQEEIERNA